MRFQSTRGDAPILGFSEVLLAGLAADGGLYVPEKWPHFSKKQWQAFSSLSYKDLAGNLLEDFLKHDPLAADFESVLSDFADSFHHKAIAPLHQIERDHWLLELFHGPTLSFKDYALQLVGRLMEKALMRAGQHITIVGATSGDTGSAAIDSVRGREGITIFMLHPKGRVSDVQRRQMTTIQDQNVHNIAIEGSFDDCQDLVKSLFADPPFRDRHHIAAVNSINWARVMAQTLYYAYAALALGAPERSLSFAVPTGNFGNIFAGWVARKMGLPIENFIIGSNKNDNVSRFFSGEPMQMRTVAPTLTPAIDIQIPSNLERLLFDLSGRDGPMVRDMVTRFRTDGQLSLPSDWKADTDDLFKAHAISDDETLGVMKDLASHYDAVIDPHTAVGLAAARHACHKNSHKYLGLKGPVVTIATAHPAKFPDAVLQATGRLPPVPSVLDGLEDKEERYHTIETDHLAVLKAYIDEKSLL